jgi:hypothetical protein
VFPSTPSGRRTGGGEDGGGHILSRADVRTCPRRCHTRCGEDAQRLRTFLVAVAHRRCRRNILPENALRLVFWACRRSPSEVVGVAQVSGKRGRGAMSFFEQSVVIASHIPIPHSSFCHSLSPGFRPLTSDLWHRAVVVRDFSSHFEHRVFALFSRVFEVGTRSG